MYGDKPLLFAGARCCRGIKPWDGAIFAAACLEQFAEFASEQEQQITLTGRCTVNPGHICDFSLCFSGLGIASQDDDAIVHRHRPRTAAAGGIGELIQGTGHGTGFFKRLRATVGEQAGNSAAATLCVALALLAIAFLQTGGEEWPAARRAAEGSPRVCVLCRTATAAPDVRPVQASPSGVSPDQKWCVPTVSLSPQSATV